jgi:hypothetical protein
MKQKWTQIILSNLKFLKFQNNNEENDNIALFKQIPKNYQCYNIMTQIHTNLIIFKALYSLNH